MKIVNNILLISGLLVGVSSCQKGPDLGIMNTGNYADTGSLLKSVTSVPIGFAAYQGDAGFAKYFPLIVKEGSNITPGNEMKHGSIVQSNGTLNFTSADALVNQAISAGLDVFGHTLCWHSQQNAGYIKSYAGITVPAATELLTNPGFENGMTTWSVFNTNGATVTANTVAAEAHAGTGSMKVVNPNNNAGGQWKVQVSSAAFATTPGKQYTISYWVKAASAGGSIRLSTGPSNAQYQGDQTIGTTWQQVSWTITAGLASTTFLFDMGLAANTYYIDDASVKEAVTVPSGIQVAAKVDTAMNTFITGMVAHYKGKVKAWDVLNEPLTDDGKLRSGTNTGGATGNDIFFWADYSYNGVPKDYAVKAFQYAAAADPNALLFINEYNLEYSKAKVDSLIAYVTYLKSKGAKIDGIGTQMHCDATTTSRAGVDYMFKQLAATGLKVRISELDVTIKGGSAVDPALGDPQVLGYQAAMYKYIVDSYLKYTPAAQRHGITFWGVDDPDSWRKTQLPLLWDKNFAKKPAYSAVLEALRNGGKGN